MNFLTVLLEPAAAVDRAFFRYERVHVFRSQSVRFNGSRVSKWSVRPNVGINWIWGMSAGKFSMGFDMPGQVYRI